MPRTVKTVQTTSRTGLVATYTAASIANGHSILNPNQDVIIHIKNAGGGASVATIVTSQAIDGLAVADRTVSVAGGAEAFIGPFSNAAYGNSDGLHLDFDVETSVTFAAFVAGVK